MAERPITFFLAHAGPDTARARELRNLLHPDIPVFLDACDLAPGGQWDAELARRQRLALATVALVSTGTDAAYYLREEIASAIAFERADPGGHRLIPVYLDGVPKDPALIPYGMRARHALDAQKLGMEGVAAELRKVAALLAGAQAPSLPADTPEPADRVAIFESLCRILPSEFEEVLFRVGAPKQHLAPASETLARRALDVVQWAEQAGPGRLNGLRDALRKAAPSALR